MANKPQPKPGSVTAEAGKIIAAIADGGMGVEIKTISEGVTEKTVTINGETHTLILTQGTDPVI